MPDAEVNSWGKSENILRRLSWIFGAPAQNKYIPAILRIIAGTKSLNLSELCTMQSVILIVPDGSCR
ncbi:hypothetical protein AAKU67_002577 [Oxalobacteraceae bacterium GrIS 2.11]